VAGSRKLARIPTVNGALHDGQAVANFEQALAAVQRTINEVSSVRAQLSREGATAILDVNARTVEQLRQLIELLENLGGRLRMEFKLDRARYSTGDCMHHCHLLSVVPLALLAMQH
jgi:hypothetical protein